MLDASNHTLAVDIARLPEQIKGYPLNQKTDLYSLGVLLFHLLTGRLPFRASNPAQLVYKIINAETTEQLRVVYHAWASSMSNHGMGAKRLPELREKLFKVL